MVEYAPFSDSVFEYKPLRFSGGLGTRFSKNMKDTVNDKNFSMFMLYAGLSHDLLKKSKVVSLNPGFEGKIGMSLDRYQIGLIPNVVLGFNSKRRTQFPIGFEIVTGYDLHLDWDKNNRASANGLYAGFSLIVGALEINYSQTHIPNNGGNYIHNISITGSVGLNKFWGKHPEDLYFYD